MRRPLRNSHVLAVVLLCLVVSIIACSNGSPDLRSIGAQLSPPAEWILKSEDLNSEAACLGSKCKTLLIQWRVSAPPTRDQIESILSDAGWSDIDVDECEERTNVVGPVPFCRGTASAPQDTTAELTVSGPLAVEPPDYVVTLRVFR